MTTTRSLFTDPALVARYIEQGPPAFTPGHVGLLQMIGVLLAEQTPTDGEILIVGAGGGLETRHLAQVGPEWRFVGVDPAKAMLDMARTIAGEAAGDRLHLIEGTVAQAPDGPFDAATCILVMGLIPDDGAKLETLRQIRRRLRQGAPFILVDQCIDRTAGDFQLRLDRYAAFARASGVDPQTVEAARAMQAQNGAMVSASRNEQLLEEAGFEHSEVFYVGMAWRGWIACA